MSWVSVSNMLTAASYLCTVLAYHYLIKCSFGLILPLDDVYMRVNVDIYMKAVNKRLFSNMRELLGERSGLCSKQPNQIIGFNSEI